MAFVDEITGELLEEWREGAIEVELELPTSEIEQQPDSEWLADWYLRKEELLKAEEEMLKEQVKKRLATVAAARLALRKRWGLRFQAVVEDDLAKQTGKRPKKSMNYSYGSAGFRSKTTTEIVDEEAALRWCSKHAPKAIKTTVSLLKSELPKGEVPGVKRTKDDHFFPAHGQ